MSRRLFLREVDSTNRYLKDHGASLPHGTMCCTGRQTAGRGRLGRHWDTPDGAALAMSVLLKDGPLGEPAALLPLLCGLAVLRTLDVLAGPDAAHPDPFALKWPNDIICSRRKVGGILCETCLEGSSGFAVAGIGINLRQSREEFDRAGLPHAISVRLCRGHAPDLEETAAAVAEALESLWGRYQREGFAPFLPEFTARCLTLGQRVRVEPVNGAPPLEGEAFAIDEKGRLLLRRDDGSLTAILAGEVSVRGLYGYC
ncbi:MAG: biotin--[acetyl-CoA-carboxylase] ligase [Clostridiales bacterium]|nr:biotin--[acetyl-CoA-carboxylase] ligase [Clostridiales bacterium]